MHVSRQDFALVGGICPSPWPAFTFSLPSVEAPVLPSRLEHQGIFRSIPREICQQRGHFWPRLGQSKKSSGRGRGLCTPVACLE